MMRWLLPALCLVIPCAYADVREINIGDAIAVSIEQPLHPLTQLQFSKTFCAWLKTWEWKPLASMIEQLNDMANIAQKYVVMSIKTKGKHGYVCKGLDSFIVPKQDFLKDLEKLIRYEKGCLVFGASVCAVSLVSALAFLIWFAVGLHRAVSHYHAYHDLCHRGTELSFFDLGKARGLYAGSSQVACATGLLGGFAGLLFLISCISCIQSALRIAALNKIKLSVSNNAFVVKRASLEMCLKRLEASLVHV